MNDLPIDTIAVEARARALRAAWFWTFAARAFTRLARRMAAD
jgi:hypothetical protein